MSIMPRVHIIEAVYLPKRKRKTEKEERSGKKRKKEVKNNQNEYAGHFNRLSCTCSQVKSSQVKSSQFVFSNPLGVTKRTENKRKINKTMTKKNTFPESFEKLSRNRILSATVGLRDLLRPPSPFNP